MFKTDTLANYPGANEICAFIAYHDNNPHDLCRSDGSQKVYHWCISVIDMDRSLAKYGADSYATYDGAKTAMRKVLRILRQHKMNKERYI